MVRDKIQKQESLESLEKEKTEKVNEVKQKQKKSEKRRSLSKEEATVKRQRTLSVGRQELEPTNGGRLTKSLTPRRLNSLDSEVQASKPRAKVSLRQSKSLESCTSSNLTSSKNKQSKIERSSIIETRVPNSPATNDENIIFIQEMLKELLAAIPVEPPTKAANKRPPTVEYVSTKRQRVDVEETNSDIDPICEDFEAYPVHFDKEFTACQPEVAEAPDDSTSVKDKKVSVESVKSEAETSHKSARVVSQQEVTTNMSIETCQDSHKPVVDINDTDVDRTEDKIGPANCDTDKVWPKDSPSKRKAGRRSPENGWTTKAKNNHHSVKPKSLDYISPKLDQDEIYKVFEFEEEKEVEIDPSLGRILELVVDDEDENKLREEKDSGNGSDREDDEAVNNATNLEDIDNMDSSKDSGGANSDIWNSILMDLDSDTMDSRKDKEEGEAVSLTEKHTCSDSSLSTKADCDWLDGLEELKDEFADDNTDIWASTNEMMNQISMSLSVAPLQPKEDQTPQEGSQSRKSRPKRKHVDENLGNPDSGKENADGDNVESEISMDAKKVERVLSPASKKKKELKNKSSRSSKDNMWEGKKSDISSSSHSSPSTKRERSRSVSTDDSFDESKSVGEKSTKQTVRLASSNRKSIQVIEPIPLNNLAESANSDKTSAPSKKTNVNGFPQKRETSKSSKSRPLQTDGRRSEESKPEGRSKSSKSTSNSKSKPDRSVKPQTKTDPSSSLVKITNSLDNEYDKLKSKPETSKASRPSK